MDSSELNLTHSDTHKVDLQPVLFHVTKFSHCQLCEVLLQVQECTIRRSLKVFRPRHKKCFVRKELGQQLLFICSLDPLSL